MKITRKKLHFLLICLVTCAFLFFGKSLKVGAEQVDLTAINSHTDTVFETQNPVVFLRFNQTVEFLTDEYKNKLDQMYNTSPISMKNYFLEQSLNTYLVDTCFIGEKSIELDHPKEYYLPRYEYVHADRAYKLINELGYDNRYYIDGELVAPSTSGALIHVEQIVREQQLLREIASKINALEGVDLSKADGDKNGVLDSFTIIVDCDYSSDMVWNTILWPHMSSAYELQLQSLQKQYYCPEQYYNQNQIGRLEDVKINSLSMKTYNLLTTGYIDNESLQGEFQGLSNVGVLCHEYLHNLGLYDYYSYIDASYQAVGEVDILGSTTAIPQMSLAYLRYKLGWLREGDNILPITSSGEYTLNAVTEDDDIKAFKIVPKDYSTHKEFFMIEMRTNQGDGFDKMLSTSGLVVYRINESNGFLDANGDYGATCYGNMYSTYESEIDEVYVFRCGNAKTLTNENFSLGIFNGDVIADGYVYNKSSLGSTNVNENQIFSESIFGSDFGSGLGLVQGTTISFSDGRNSCIKLSKIKLSSDKKSVSFEVEYGFESSAINEDNISADIERFYDNSIRFNWNTPALDGTVYTIAVKYDSQLINSVDGKVVALKTPTAQEIINGKMEGYSTIFAQNTPISFNRMVIEDYGENVAIFALFTDGENQVIKFLGTIKNSDDGIGGSFFNSVYFKYALIIVGCFFVIVAIALLIVGIKIFKKSRS